MYNKAAHTFALLTFCLCFASQNCHAQTSLVYDLFGASSFETFGGDARGAGDVNGDGAGDFIIAAWGTASGSGSVKVFSGADGSILFTKLGDSPGDRFGRAAGGAGDVNGDGFADFIVGADLDDNGGIESGSARGLSGLNGSTLYSYNGNSPGAFFGRTVSGAGDVNGDGFADFMVGAPGADSNGIDRGLVVVYSGVDGSVLYTKIGDSALDEFGDHISGAGDVNADGFDDFIIGVWHDNDNGFHSGSASVYSGIDGALLYDLNGDSPGDLFGQSVSDAGDVNCDGFDDFIIGAIYDDNTGLDSGNARVYSGVDGSILHDINGLHAGDNFGVSVSGAGDLNGDGYADFIVGGFGHFAFSGGARLFSGVDGSLIFQGFGSAANAGYGFRVAGIGDIDGNGFDDFLVSSPSSPVSAPFAGRVRVFAADTLPVLSYNSPQNSGSSLKLRWSPNGGNANAMLGTISVSDATPGGIGLFGVSLAPADLQLPYGFPLLIANNPANLLLSGNFGFDLAGELTVLNASRQSAALAGAQAYIQFFEVSPNIAGSNGLRMALVP